MNLRPSVVTAIICELLGLALMLFINRLLPVPLDIIVTFIGFLLLMLGPFVLFYGRNRD